MQRFYEGLRCFDACFGFGYGFAVFVALCVWCSWLLMVLLGLIAVYGRVGLLFSVDCLFLCGYYLMVGLFGLTAGWVFGG